jgi:hypothetical protein
MSNGNIKENNVSGEQSATGAWGADNLTAIYEPIV